MKRQLRIGAFVASCAIAIACTPAHAYYNSQQPNEADLDSHRHYRNHDGNVIHSPARSRSGAVPEGASAQCRDGTYSFSQHHSGTCSRHGGVARWE
ncbi:conserved exported hypothetical protein [Burkholderia sp. 8Y]|uniref:DUF3761 domain-containing protein n=1 Tax=Burkholderia sp. 8Y TaxID=2653133 RepID=UPI0012F2E7ED|nr:DUF3761 domain-containing protein [Burkholderia sp. 8Y]VXC45469.1 conserved exported hypothetical protein [Burkholderia sp. 8Y]